MSWSISDHVYYMYTIFIECVRYTLTDRIIAITFMYRTKYYCSVALTFSMCSELGKIFCRIHY